MFPYLVTLKNEEKHHYVFFIFYLCELVHIMQLYPISEDNTVLFPFHETCLTKYKNHQRIMIFYFTTAV